ncbi:MAG: methyltransferase domain-containing protein [Hyphomicrobiaceae bacterium]|nr:methyltransferase domain-containing protein [Hyphomicrobiaceae bacterium]
MLLALAAPVPAHAQSPVTQPQRPGGPRLDVDFEATPAVVARAMLDLARVGPGDVVMDLGCGEGDIANAAAKLKGARSICVELDPQRIAKARENAARLGVADKVTFLEGDLFAADLAPASVITLFLWDTLNLRLRPRLLELAPGTRIVSHGHNMGAWRPDRSEWHNHRSKDGPSAIYLWYVPARLAGSWTLHLDGERYALRLSQSYQTLAGTATSAKSVTRLRAGRVEGTAVVLDLVTQGGRLVRIAGRAEGDRIVPDVPAGAAVRPPAAAHFELVREGP